jgi:uncharacterized membrane protein
VTAVERIVSRILWWGGVASITLMLIGLVGDVVRVGIGSESFDVPRAIENQEAGRPPRVFTSLPQVVDGLRRRPIDPLAVAAVGLLTLLATPVAAVVVAVPVFLAGGDRRYALIAALLAVALIGSLLIGGSG